jgi:hypothetical protein
VHSIGRHWACHWATRAAISDSLPLSLATVRWGLNSPRAACSTQAGNSAARVFCNFTRAPGGSQIGASQTVVLPR